MGVRARHSFGRWSFRLGKALPFVCALNFVVPVQAATIFSSATPGLTSVTLAAGTYDLFATGGSGGTAYPFPNTTTVGAFGGFAAQVTARFTFLTDETIAILVGGAGQSVLQSAGGGGGASYLVGPANRPLLIAGGGGGGTVSSQGDQGGNAQGFAATGGAGGAVGTNSRPDTVDPDPALTEGIRDGGGGGGGLVGDGGGNLPLRGVTFPTGGQAFANGGAVGRSPFLNPGGGGIGGFGGGGAGAPYRGSGGGGGGFTGGAGGDANDTGRYGGAGGTSFASGTDSSFVLASSRGDGSVRIDLIALLPAAVPEPATWMMLVTGFILLGGMLRRDLDGAASTGRSAPR